MLKKRRVLVKNKTYSRGLFVAIFIGAFAVLGGSILFKNSFAEGSYTVYFRNGATNATFSTQTVEDGASPSIPGNPGADGFTFTGNYQSSSPISLRSGGSISANTPFSSAQISDIAVHSNLTLISVMAGNKYTVTTVMTGDVPSGLRGSATTFTYGNNLRINLPSMTNYAKNGYTFMGWNSEVPIYNNSWLYLPTKNIRVIGTWKYTGGGPAPVNNNSSSNGSGQSYSAQPSAGAAPAPSAPAPTSSSSSSASASKSPSVTTPKTGNGKIDTILPNDNNMSGQIVCLSIIGAILAVFAFNHRKKLALRSR